MFLLFGQCSSGLGYSDAVFLVVKIPSSGGWDTAFRLAEGELIREQRVCLLIRLACNDRKSELWGIVFRLFSEYFARFWDIGLLRCRTVGRRNCSVEL